MSIQEERWAQWRHQPPEAQVALDAALERLAQEPEYPGCRWALPATGNLPMPPHMGWPGQAEPGVTWEALAQAQGDTLQTPNRMYLPALDMVMVRVAKGSFQAGVPGHQPYYRAARTAVLTRDFWISKFPVTNRQYIKFTESGAHPSQSLKNMSFAFFYQPASGVSFGEAQQYCQWASEITGYKIRLPTEVEWVRASRDQPRRFPWGTEDLTHAWHRPSGPTSSVLLRPQSASPWGCEDMVGNVWEWCLDYYGTWPRETLKDWHRDKPVRNEPPWRVLKGGAYLTRADNLHIDFAGRRKEEERDLSIGFRIMMPAKG